MNPTASRLECIFNVISFDGNVYSRPWALATSSGRITVVASCSLKIIFTPSKLLKIISFLHFKRTNFCFFWRCKNKKSSLNKRCYRRKQLADIFFANRTCDWKTFVGFFWSLSPTFLYLRSEVNFWEINIVLQFFFMEAKIYFFLEKKFFYQIFGHL